MTTRKYSKPLIQRPRFSHDGEIRYLLPKAMVERHDEIAITIELICNRKLFGECYRRLMPNCYRSLGRKSGVMIGAFIPSKLIIPEMKFPGDFDLLIIPYNNDRLLISETLIVEIKIVRAKYIKQGKAPNEFGFSQANATLQNGFPYAAVAHLVTSDTSPIEEWREMLSATVADADTGKLEDLKEIAVDMRPFNLMLRSFGRLNSNCNDNSLGLLAAYISTENTGLWFPQGRPAKKNPLASMPTLRAIAEYYNANFKSFLDTPKYDSLLA